MGRMLSILIFGLVLANLGLAPTQDGNQVSQKPPKPKEMSVFLQTVKRQIVKACFRATEKTPAYRVSFTMSSTEHASNGVSEYGDRDAKAREIFKGVREDGLLDQQYQLTFKPEDIRKIKQPVLDANGEEVKQNGLVVFEDAYEISGSWRGYNRPWHTYAPISALGHYPTEEEARRRKDEAELIDIRCIVPHNMVTPEDVENAKEITVICTIEDWCFRGSVYWDKTKGLNHIYTAAVAPSLSGLNLRATSITLKKATAK